MKNQKRKKDKVDITTKTTEAILEEAQRLIADALKYGYDSPEGWAIVHGAVTTVRIHAEEMEKHSL